jgi:site-specific DNA recombinase
MILVDLYIRVSTDEQAEKGYSQRDQEERLRKYCELNGYQIRKVVIEDHSAKTFNRPAWAGLLSLIKKTRGQTDFVLFTKWDRFSRNAGDAYSMISILRNYGIEPQAVEQPLDLTIPENKMMLAFYLAAPEVENDRRALNVFHGMRRAKKEGRYMATAPLGYINRNIDDHKFIEPREGEADILKWAFEELASGKSNTEQVWKTARSKGLRRGSKNNFWVAIRNPLYCGKIFVPKYKDEEAELVQGQHTPIISEALFYEVQDILDGRKKKQRPKTPIDEKLPLRGFLICPSCGRLLSGSGSKGRTKYYHYYHCSSECGVRYKAEDVNGEMVNEISKYDLPHERLLAFKHIVVTTFNDKTKFNRTEVKHLRSQLEDASKKVLQARDLLLKGDLDPDDYRAIKSEMEAKINRLEVQITSLNSKTERIEPLVEGALGGLSKLKKLYVEGDTVRKRKIIGSIYPEKIQFDGFHFRTTRRNEALDLLLLIHSKLEGIKKGTSIDLSNLSLLVIPLGLEPRAHTLKVYCSTN